MTLLFDIPPREFCTPVCIMTKILHIKKGHRTVVVRREESVFFFFLIQFLPMLIYSLNTVRLIAQVRIYELHDLGEAQF